MGKTGSMIALSIVLLFVGAYLLLYSSGKIGDFLPITPVTISSIFIALPCSICLLIPYIFGERAETLIKQALCANIGSIGLILGVISIFFPISFPSQIRKEKMITIGCIFLLLFFVLLGGKLSRVESYFLITIFLLFIVLQLMLGQTRAKFSSSKIAFAPFLFWVLGSLTLFVAYYLLWLDKRDLFHWKISLLPLLPPCSITIIAIIQKKFPVIFCLGLGTSAYNLLLVVPVTAMQRRVYLSESVLGWFFPVMILFFLMFWISTTSRKILPAKMWGSMLCIGYLFFLFLTNF